MVRLVNMELGFLSFEKTDNVLSKLSSDLCIPFYIKYECLENSKSDSEKLMIALEEITSLEKKLNGVVGIARLLLKEISQERFSTKREVCSENATLKEEKPESVHEENDLEEEKENSNEDLIKKTFEIATQTEPVEENNSTNKGDEEKVISDIVESDDNEKNDISEKIAKKKEKIARLKEEIEKINERNEKNAIEFSEEVLRLADLEGKK